MLKVFYYNDRREIFKEEFPSNVLVICPDPSTTDSFRYATQSKFEVITIAKWLSDIKLDSEQKKIGKSELMLRVASAWRNYYPEGSEHLFNNAFELFTELRSFTLDLGILQNVMANLDPDIQKSINIFWAVTNALNLVDEHLAYEMKKKFVADRPILFFGFKHLSAIQIDLIKFISETVDVIFYIPQLVKLNSMSSDWINWLDTVDLKEAAVAPSSNANLNLINFQSKKINQYLKTYNEKQEINKIVLMGAQSEIGNIQEICIENFYFKEPIDLFKTEKKTAFNGLEETNAENLLSLIESMQLNKQTSVKDGSYKLAKIYELIIGALTIYSEYSLELDAFTLSLIKYVVDLNTPRNFFVPLVEKSEKKILSFKELKFLEKNEEVALIFTKDNSPFKALENKYPDEILKELRLLGPLRRGGLDILFLKSELYDFLGTNSTTIFLEEGLLETDPGIRDLLKNFNFNILNLDLEFPSKKISDNFKKYMNITKTKSKSISASSLQSYNDCPRKYFITYLDKIDDSPSVKIGISPDEMGSLEHSIIEEYFTENERYESETLRNKCNAKLIEHIKNRNSIISYKEQQEVLFELVEYTFNGLDFLYELKKNRPSAQINFEHSITENQWNLKGYIDVLVEENNALEIYDFKRSQASVGSKKALESYEKLQLWIYSLAMNSNLKPVTKIGYVNISEIDKKTEMNLTQSDLDIFSEYLNKLITRFEVDSEYLAIPRKEDVCNYCPIRKICSKGVN